MHGTSRLRILLLPFVLGLSACQTVEDAPGSSWSSAPVTPPMRVSEGRSRSDRIGGALLLANTRGGQSTMLEGTGRFVGEPATGAIGRASDDVADGVTLNLVNVPAPQAAKTILGDILAVKYTVDPGIEGKITIQTPKPVARSAVIDLFQSALRSNNAFIINTNGSYRIAPLDQAMVGAGINTDDSPDRELIGNGLQVVQLKYVAASEIRRVLETVAPRGGIVRTDDARNLITLSGNRQDIASMMEAIALFDIDTMKGMSFALVPVKTSQPDAIAGELKTVFATDREGPMAGMVQFLPNKRRGAILVISPQTQYLRRAETWIRRLDAQAQGSEKQLFTYSVQNRRAQELVDVLQSMFSNEAGGAPQCCAGLSGGERAVRHVAAVRSGLRRAGRHRIARIRVRRLRRRQSFAVRAGKCPCIVFRLDRATGQGRRDRRSAGQDRRRRRQERGADRSDQGGLRARGAGDGQARRDAEPGADRGDHRRSHA